MTREAFENTIVINSAIGGSTNAPIHLNGIAKHLGVPLNNDDWQNVGHEIPLLVNMQPAGEYLGEDYQHAGGVPAVIGELIAADLLPHPDVITANGKTMRENCGACAARTPRVIRSATDPMKEHAGFINLKGNLFDSAIMKTSVISRRSAHATCRTRTIPRRLKGVPWSLTGPRISTTASTIRRKTSTTVASCSCAAQAPKGIPAGPKS